MVRFMANILPVEDLENLVWVCSTEEMDIAEKNGETFSGHGFGKLLTGYRYNGSLFVAKITKIDQLT